jgi:hypothetical protein
MYRSSDNKKHPCFLLPSNAEINDSKTYMKQSKEENGEIRIGKTFEQVPPAYTKPKTVKRKDRIDPKEIHFDEFNARCDASNNLFCNILSNAKLGLEFNYELFYDQWLRSFIQCLVEFNLNQNHLKLLPPNFQQIDYVTEHLLPNISTHKNVRLSLTQFMKSIGQETLEYQPYWQHIYKKYEEGLDHPPNCSSQHK